MLPLVYVGIAPEELDRLVEGEVWERWVGAEVALAEVGSLAQLHRLRGLATDGPLGALVRLAARDGGDDELAGIAVVHQLEGGVRRLARSFGDLSSDIEAVLIGALWEQIRTFPWRRRTRAYAANLILDTKTAAMAHLQSGRTRRGAEPVLFVDTTTSPLDGLADQGWHQHSAQADCEQAADDLAALLDWAKARGVVARDDVLLLAELVQAGREVADRETRRTLRGVCSEAAVLRVAQRRGVSARTIVRHRNRVVAVLRDAAPRYLAEVA
jgi:hypothetical protein